MLKLQVIYADLPRIYLNLIDKYKYGISSIYIHYIFDVWIIKNKIVNGARDFNKDIWFDFIRKII